MWCPFGCRQAHRQQRSPERSVSCYATAEGKVKKKMQNGKRSHGGVRAEVDPPFAEAREFRAAIVGYVVLLASLIEGRRMNEAEMLQRLVRAMRQHSMARRPRKDYVVAQLHQHGLWG